MNHGTLTSYGVNQRIFLRIFWCEVEDIENIAYIIWDGSRNPLDLKHSILDNGVD